MISDLMFLFASLPDNSFNFEAIPNGEKGDKATVICTKDVSPKLYDQFDEIKVAINELGQKTITFTRKYFSKNDVRQIISIINETYSKFGNDLDGNSCLTSENIGDLSTPLFDNYYSMILLNWNKDGKIYASIFATTNDSMSLTFKDIESDKKDDLLKQFYAPFIGKESNGLLTNRKQLLDKTVAKIISDEFSKGIIVGITDVAGDTNQYVFTYSIDDKSLTDRTEIGLSFAYSMGYFIIQIRCKDKLFQIDIGDSIIFLFQNEEKLEITFDTSSTFLSESEYSNNHVLRNEEIILFMNQPLKKWKLIQGNKAYKIGGFTLWYLSNQYKSVLEGQYLIQKIAKEVVNTATLNDGKSFDATSLNPTLDGKVASITNANPSLSNHQDQSLEEVLQELNSLIGLAKVKEEIKTLTNFIRIQKAREQSGLKSSSLSYHIVFTGNPGTGKTTVARIIAKIYRCLGILKKGQLIEIDRGGLIGEYLGQTSPKVNKVVDSALDGVLFIDEAYSIVSSKTDDYGKEAVATLIKRVEDDRDRLAVVMAGYNNEMRDFINTNPGFSSRFNRYINFPDYTPEELVEIFQALCKQNEYVLENEAKHKLAYIIEETCTKRDNTFGNGRYVRNLFEQTLETQSNRLSTQSNIDKESLVIITADDISL